MVNEDEYVIDSSRGSIFNFKELWTYKELFYFYAWRDLKVKYKQTVLGVLWVVLQPLLMVLIFSLFFSRVMNVQHSDVPYPIFVFSGLLLWTFFSSSISAAGSSMISNSEVVKKIYFPRIIIPVSSILVSSIDFIVAFVVFVLAFLYYGVHADFLVLLGCWLVSIFLMFLSTLGISCWLSALMVKYRDFRHVIPFGLQIGLFVSPVIYPNTFVGRDWLNYVIAMNTMYAPITLFRTPFMNDPLRIELILISISVMILLLLIGISYFKKTEAYFADIA